MCAAAATAPVDLRAHSREVGMLFWERLVMECKEQIQAINSALLKHGDGLIDRVEMRADEQLQLIKTQYPSTTVYASIDFERWGTVIRVSIRGHQRPDFGFYPEDFEMPLATDSDGTTVAVFDEGKSLRPAELAAFLVQTFRRCFPRISLPCSGRAVA